MKKVRLGKNGDGEVLLDLPALLKGKLLAAASSGGGKSNLIRLLCERLYQQVPIIILDPEGEFPSLRKVCPDFLIFGKGGDMPIHSGMAPMLAIRLWENRCSAVIDLSELNHVEKHRFVARFTKALVDADKRFWNPLVLFFDEAHEFCPENGEGSSEAKGPILEMMAKARKRMIAPGLATQRAAKLDKSAISECRNLMVGFLNRHDDRRSLGKELGFSTKDELFSIKTLNEGEFWMLGPAISKEVGKVQVDLAKTNPTDHHSFSRRIKGIAKPSAKVKALLDKLQDLPKEAEQELKTIEELKAKVKELTAMTKYKALKIDSPQAAQLAKISEVELKRIRKEAQDQVNKATAEFDRRRIEEIKKAMSDLREGLDKVIGEAMRKNHPLPKKFEIQFNIEKPMSTPIIHKMKLINTAQVINKGQLLTSADVTEKPFGPTERLIAGFLSIDPSRGWSRAQIGMGSGRSHTSSGFKNALSRLRVAGIIEGSSDSIRINYTVAGEKLGTLAIPGENARKAWEANLGKCELALLQTLEARPHDAFTRESLCEATPPYQPKSSGVKNAISRLNVLELIIKDGDSIQLNPQVLEVSR